MSSFGGDAVSKYSPEKTEPGWEAYQKAFRAVAARKREKGMIFLVRYTLEKLSTSFKVVVGKG